MIMCCVFCFNVYHRKGEKGLSPFELPWDHMGCSGDFFSWNFIIAQFLRSILSIYSSEKACKPTKLWVFKGQEPFYPLPWPAAQMPKLKLVIAHLLFRFCGGGSGGFPLFIYTTGNCHQNRKIKQFKNRPLITPSYCSVARLERSCYSNHKCF